jgi:hypothetical protein
MFKAKSIKAFLAFALLICFSVVALPLDLLHNHQEEEIQCSDYGHEGSCSHKVHISKKKSFCFACTLHFDKDFTNEKTEYRQVDAPWVQLFLENKVAAIIIEPLLTLLRGPPSQ